MGKKGRICCLTVVLLVVAAAAGLAIRTRMDLMPLPVSLARLADPGDTPRLLDRHGTPLTATYTPVWNLHDVVALHDIPRLLQQAFIFSEDCRFYAHQGMDHQARLHALWQNIRAGRVVRGASTITEQVVRLLHPRPRTLWSRWLEGWEARRLEQRFSKSDILFFYLNQVPYASRRRGVAQAARFYFDRTLDTLNTRECLALAVLVRAPDGYDLYRRPGRINGPLATLARRMEAQGLLATGAAGAIDRPFQLQRPTLSVAAPHFSRYVLSQCRQFSRTAVAERVTTLDGPLQKRVQSLLDTALVSHVHHRVRNGGALVVDHTTGHILAWAAASVPGAAGEGASLADPLQPAGSSGEEINTVIVPRQPGSAMKPFVYALALEKGWTPATLISDSPLARQVGQGGLHAYHNYSRQYHGLVTLRNALGNSLNIPAVRAIQFVGVDTCLQRLQQMGFTTLDRHPDFYGDGLALGNGEVTLYELVQAYTALANQGVLVPLLPVSGFHGLEKKRIFSPEVASLVGHILSDPGARTLEFGTGGVLNFPVQTAVKTGTSSDYRDAWAVGFNRDFTAGVWMGNLDATPTRGLTGSRGPAVVLRSIFARLNHYRSPRPLFMSPRLIRQETVTRTEWFLPGTVPVAEAAGLPGSDRSRGMPGEDTARGQVRSGICIEQPRNGLELAMDPRIPDDHEVLVCRVAGTRPGDDITWYLDGVPVAGHGPQLDWPLARGRHCLAVEVNRGRDHQRFRDQVVYQVK